MQVEQGSVLAALKVVKDPDLHRDIVSLGFIKELKIDGGRVVHDRADDARVPGEGSAARPGARRRDAGERQRGRRR
jgi:hypothetical protein